MRGNGDGMKVKLIGHSGFRVELPEMTLLFDYSEGELPAADPAKPLFVFVSHAHEDHYSKKIFTYLSQTDDVTYFLSDDIPRGSVPEKAADHVRFLGPDCALAVSRLVYDPEAGRKRGKTILEIHTYRSTDEGIAFLIDAGKVRIYHAGDLNDWHWDEEDQAFNREQREGYTAALTKMKYLVKRDNHVPDLAFVPLDSRLGEFFWMGMDEYMKAVGASHVFPMHIFGDTSVIGRMKKMPCAAGYADRILGTGTAGEEFDL